MAGKFKVLDKHRAFALEVVAGTTQWEAWLKHIGGKGTSKQTAHVKASELMKRHEIRNLIARYEEERNQAIIEAHHKNLPEEFKTIPLTVDQLDAFHYSVALGKVEVEELVPITTIIKDDKGREKSRTTTIHKVKRKPNIREKQASIDAIYKRWGSYAPSKLLGAFKNLGGDEETDDNVERFVLLSTGEKIPMP